MQTFDEFEVERARLIQVCDSLEGIWHDTLASRSEFEVLAGAAPSPADDSAVVVAINDARRRLNSSTIEIGVFGNIKRGKSTLLNAVVGEVVSSMRVTPETAVPVWVESGPRRSIVLFDDGTSEDIDDATAAAEMATQRYRRSQGRRKVVRVVQQLPIEWLPVGLRVVDTPGLDDPSMIDDYEQVTLAELDRVAAAVFVFGSPPGPAGEEIRLLRTLGARGIDKVFLVCNFYPDQWADGEVRAEISEFIESTVAEGSDLPNAPEAVHVYQVNAKAGLTSMEQADSNGYEASGVLALRNDLERFLSQEALPWTLGAAARRIQTAVDLNSDLLLERERMLANPHVIESFRATSKRRLESSRAALHDVVDGVDEAAHRLGDSLAGLVAEPFAIARASVEKAVTIGDLERVEHRLRLQVETAAARSSTLFGQETAIAEQRARRAIYDSFGVTERLDVAGRVTLDLSALADHDGLGSAMVRTTDWATVGSTASLTAVGGGLIGGSIAGGVGVALLAAGPVGWIAGFAIGGVVGALTGGAVGGIATKSRLTADGRSAAAAVLSSRRAKAEQVARSAALAWAASLRTTIQGEHRRYFGDQADEFSRLEAIARDDSGRRHELARTSALLERLRALR